MPKIENSDYFGKWSNLVQKAIFEFNFNCGGKGGPQVHTYIETACDFY